MFSRRWGDRTEVPSHSITTTRRSPKSIRHRAWVRTAWSNEVTIAHAKVAAAHVEETRRIVLLHHSAMEPHFRKPHGTTQKERKKNGKCLCADTEEAVQPVAVI